MSIMRLRNSEADLPVRLIGGDLEFSVKRFLIKWDVTQFMTYLTSLLFYIKIVAKIDLKRCII